MLAAVDLGHVAAEERRDRDQYRAKGKDLQPAIYRHDLELLPTYQGVGEVDTDQDGDHEPEEVRGTHVRDEERERGHTRSIASMIR